MRIWPTMGELCRTLAFSWMVAFGLMALGYHHLCKLYEKKWDEVIETAKFNDLSGVGQAHVLIIYNEE